MVGSCAARGGVQARARQAGSQWGGGMRMQQRKAMYGRDAMAQHESIGEGCDKLSTAPINRRGMSQHSTASQSGKDATTSTASIRSRVASPPVTHPNPVQTYKIAPAGVQTKRRGRDATRRPGLPAGPRASSRSL
eukprot:6848015-Prymnesium_polylepis.1